jgi:hypothetical protein
MKRPKFNSSRKLPTGLLTSNILLFHGMNSFSLGSGTTGSGFLATGRNFPSIVSWEQGCPDMKRTNDLYVPQCLRNRVVRWVVNAFQRTLRRICLPPWFRSEHCQSATAIGLIVSRTEFFTKRGSEPKFPLQSSGMPNLPP